MCVCVNDLPICRCVTYPTKNLLSLTLGSPLALLVEVDTLILLIPTGIVNSACLNVSVINTKSMC